MLQREEFEQAFADAGLPLRAQTIDYEAGPQPAPPAEEDDDTPPIAIPPPPPYRVGIVGSRDYPKMEQVREYIRMLAEHQQKRPICIVSGTAPGSRGRRFGVDEVAIDEARRIGLQNKVYEPKSREIKAEYLARNTVIVNNSDAVVGFWDGWSRGTADVLAKALRAQKLKAVYDQAGEKMDFQRVEQRLQQLGKL